MGDETDYTQDLSFLGVDERRPLPGIQSERDGRVDWTCGCVTYTEAGRYCILPCSTACRVYVIALEKSRRRGNRVEFQVVKDDE